MKMFWTYYCRSNKLVEILNLHWNVPPKRFSIFHSSARACFSNRHNRNLFLSHFYVPSDVLHSNKQNKSRKDGKFDRSQREGAQKCHNLELSCVFLFPAFSFTSGGDFWKYLNVLMFVSFRNRVCHTLVTVKDEPCRSLSEPSGKFRW